jgi:SWIM zinc finger
MPQVVKGQPVMQYLGEGKVWITQSKSSPGTWHVTIYNEDKGTYDCTCPGQRYQKRCWHVDQVRGDATENDDFQVNL